MTGLIIALQVLAALFLILVVLLQPGNRGGATAALGGSGSGTFFGGRGANTFLSKLTVAAAVVFMLTNLTLSRLSGRGSVLDTVPKPAMQVPAAAPKDTTQKPTDTNSQPEPSNKPDAAAPANGNAKSATPQ